MAGNQIFSCVIWTELNSNLLLYKHRVIQGAFSARNWRISHSAATTCNLTELERHFNQPKQSPRSPDRSPNAARWRMFGMDRLDVVLEQFDKEWENLKVGGCPSFILPVKTFKLHRLPGKHEKHSIGLRTKCEAL